ncbi:MAG: peptidase [Lachnospiraceae bacterium]|nr:peptidase [Lachnospiraceae bacterium]
MSPCAPNRQINRTSIFKAERESEKGKFRSDDAYCVNKRSMLFLPEMIHTFQGNELGDTMDCKEMALSNEAHDFITDYVFDRLNLWESLCYTNIENRYNIVYYEGSPTEPLTNYYYYQNIPKLYGLMQVQQEGQRIFDPSNLIASGITQVQRAPLELTGRGAIVCIIDTGIDYTNPAFLDENGNSRILAIWDQTIQEGTPPEGFFFGTEYRREEINRALQNQVPYSVVPTRDDNGHGSAMAGVAAGSNVRTGNVYIGAAPNADIVIVKLKECKPYLRRFWMVPEGVPAYQENDIMLAVKYADSFAVPFTRPVVICLGVGTNMGDHNGSSALSRYLSTVAIKRSRAVVVGGGNEGNASHHYLGILSRDRWENSTQTVEVRVGEGVSGFSMELWGSLPDMFNVSIRTPGGENIPQARPNIRESETYDFIYERSRVTVDSFPVEAASGDQLLLFRIQEPTPGIWTFQVSATDDVHNGQFHIWLPIREFLNGDVYFLSPNPYTTLTEPAMASDIISVSAYNAENDSFYIESGRGFSRDGRIRPDMAAPGVNVSTISGLNSGSSMAAAITAGAVAQFMQWAVVENNNELAESREIKSLLIRGALREQGIIYPNREWGYGRLNLEATFEEMASL